MPRIIVTLACGCRLPMDEAASPDERAEPYCAEHDEHRVMRVEAPAPRFRGAVRGPLAVEEPVKES